MGAGVCCVQKRVEFTTDWLAEGGGLALSRVEVVPAMLDAQPARRAGYPGASSSRAAPGDVDPSEEIAWQIAVDRRQQSHEAASLLPVLYDVRPPEPDDSPHGSTAVHRRTQATRRLGTYVKPQSVPAQERLRSYIESLQMLSAESESIAKVFEVFEDYMHVHLVTEQCTGGTIYERILDRQYFTEQESSMLVKHMLEVLLPFHERHLYHGCLSADSFRFLSDSPHAPLKLVDFGIELKAHRWDAAECVSGGPDMQNPQSPHFYETCRVVFIAPEMAPPHQARKRFGRGANNIPLLLAADVQDMQQAQADASPREEKDLAAGEDLLDSELLADVIDEHAEWFNQQQQQEAARDYSRKYAAADIWSVGAIAFTLLCGYPPFFAPARNTIIGRIHRGEVAFDPPFWSKISEEGKSFVRSCLELSPWDRPSVAEALRHPWIQRLADSSPSGSMFASFMLNLRRFYRTALIETYTANMLAARFCREDMHDFLRRCREIDVCGNGFFTASDLKHVLAALGHSYVSDAIAARFLLSLRHPGESYIDYIALLDAVYLRQQRIFEEDLWRNFQRVCQSAGRAANEAAGRLSVGEVGMVLGDPVIMGLLMREIPQSAGVEEVAVCQRLQNAIRQHCAERGATFIEFRALSALMLRQLRIYTVPRGLAGLLGGAELEVVDTVSTVL